MTFDTLEFARRLKGAGFTEQQAEVLAGATRELVTDEMVTKSFLQAEIQKLDQKLESEIEKLAMRLTIRMGTIAAVCVGALAAIIKL
jgi:hypothetical protein